MAGPGENRHLWADDVEEDEAEERQRQGAHTAGAGRPLSYAAAAGPAAAASSPTTGSWTGRAEAAQRCWEPGLSSPGGGRPDSGASVPLGETRDEWYEGMHVQRGASRQRLNMQHGFLKEIVSGGSHPPQEPAFGRSKSAAPWS